MEAARWRAPISAQRGPSTERWEGREAAPGARVLRPPHVPRGVPKPRAPCSSHAPQPDISDGAGSRRGGPRAYARGKSLPTLPTPSSPAGGELNPALEPEPLSVPLFSLLSSICGFSSGAGKQRVGSDVLPSDHSCAVEHPADGCKGSDKRGRVCDVKGAVPRGRACPDAAWGCGARDVPRALGQRRRLWGTGRGTFASSSPGGGSALGRSI